MELVDRRVVARWLYAHYLVSQRRVCGLLVLAESIFRYLSRRNEKFRALSVVGPYTRECLALAVDTSMGSRRVTRVLEGIIAERGMPQAIRADNGPEFTSRHFLAWCLERKIEVVHIEPGKPVQNAHVESFHGKLRDECLNASWFANLFEALRKIAAWRRECNEERPHSSLGYRAPAEFARQMAALRSPTAPCEPPFGPNTEAQAMSSGGSYAVI